MKYQSYLIFCQCLFICNVYNIVESKAVIGPNVRQTVEHEFPYAVFISLAPDRFYNPILALSCGGALITVRDVLTSEHCLKDKTTEDLIINVGSHDIRQAVQYYPEWWVNYEMWSLHKGRRVEYPGQSLLSIIRLSQNVTEVPFVPLLFLNKRSIFGMTVAIATWGISNNAEVPNIQQTAELIILTDDDCEQRYTAQCGKFKPVHDAFLCTAANPYVITTAGDHGSPITLNGQLVGITRAPAPLYGRRINPNQLNIHYSIGYFEEFISDILQNCA